MKALVIGYSSIARRRMMPAMLATGVTSLDVASLSKDAVDWGEFGPGKLYRSYERAINSSDADFVYISTINSEHARLAKLALERNLHVMIDKPAVLSVAEANDLVAIARSRGLVLAEAIVWFYHPRVQTALDFFGNLEVTHINAIFSIPSLPASDFRYRQYLGGGAINDLAPYMVTSGRIFFKTAPRAVHAWEDKPASGVDISCSILASHNPGRAMTGFIGFTTAYCNMLEVLGPNISLRMDRIYSPPANLSTSLFVQNDLGTKSIDFPPADNFALFLQRFFAAMRGETRLAGRFTDEFIADSATMEALRVAAKT
jgi:dTDP-3,4-didehydro-2,6-dideoxy-alpha-D-glucose 3-reductase